MRKKNNNQRQEGGKKKKKKIRQIRKKRSLEIQKGNQGESGKSENRYKNIFKKREKKENQKK